MRPLSACNSLCRQQAQRCIVSNALLAKEGHCIDLGTGIVVSAKKSDLLNPSLAIFPLPWAAKAFLAPSRAHPITSDCSICRSLGV